MSSLEAALRAVLDDVLRERVPELVRAVIREELAVRAIGVAEPRARADAEYMSTAAAAKHASVRPETVREWITKGALTRYSAGRHIRIRREELDLLLAASSGPPTGSHDGSTASTIASRILGTPARRQKASG